MNELPASEGLNSERSEEDDFTAIQNKLIRKKNAMKNAFSRASHTVVHPEDPTGIPNEPFSLKDLISPPKCGILPPKPEPVQKAAPVKTEEPVSSRLSTLTEDAAPFSPDSAISHVESTQWTPPVRGVMATKTGKQTKPAPQEQPTKPQPKPTAQGPSLLTRLFSKSAKPALTPSPKKAPASESLPEDGTASSALPKQVKPMQDADARFKERQKHLQELIDKERGKLT